MIQMRRQVAASCAVASIAIGAAIYAGCGGVKDLTGQGDSDNNSSGESDIVLTGQLALTGEPASLRLMADAPALSDLDIYCVTFQLPPVAGTGDIGSDGAFELTLDASNTSVGCFVLNGEDVLGTLVFEDPSKKDLGGGSKTADRYGFAGGKSNLGSIVLDLATGKATVDVTKIVNEKKKDTEAAAAEAVDLTGTYKITSAGITVPKGYVGACPEQKGDGPHDCEGPPEGYEVWIKTFKGKDASTGKPVNAMMFWQSEELFKQCGSKLGFTYAQGKEHGVDFSGSGIGEGEFDWDSSLEDGWKDLTATARWSTSKMQNVENFKGYAGTKQFFFQYRKHECEPGQPCQASEPTKQSGFMFNANSSDTGCRDEDGKAVQLNDWNDMECEFEQLSGEASGLSKNVCSKVSNGKKVTCVHIGGTFDDDENPLEGGFAQYPDDFVVYAQGAYCDYNKNGKYDQNEWAQGGGGGEMQCNNGIQPTPGDLCSDIPATDDAGKLAQMRCFLENSGGKDDREISICAREVRANWSATTPDEFLGKTDGPVKAKGEHVFELFEYDSATSGSLRGEDREFRGIQVGNNWTDCEVINVFTMALRKIDGSNDLLAEMSESQKNVSNKPACIAEYGEGKTQKMMFKLVKK